MLLRTFLATALLAAAAACSPGKQEVKAPDSVPEMTKAEVWAIVKEELLKEPEVLVAAFEELDRRQSMEAFRMLIASNDDPALGPKDAKITIVEFFDYNCPYCHQANEWLMKQIDDRSNGGVRVIFKELPILRDSSQVAALGALAAERQGKYREMHVALMKSRALSVLDASGQREDLAKTQAEIDRIARSIGLNVERLRKDMEDEALQTKLIRVSREAAQIGLSATPRFYINGHTVESGFSEEQLDEVMKTVREEIKK